MEGAESGSVSSASREIPAPNLAPVPGLYNTTTAEYTRWMKEGREVLGTPHYTVYSLSESEKKRLDTGDAVVVASSRECRLVCGIVLERHRNNVLQVFTDRFDDVHLSSTLYRLHASRRDPIVCYQQTV